MREITKHTETRKISLWQNVGKIAIKWHETLFFERVMIKYVNKEKGTNSKRCVQWMFTICSWDFLSIYTSVQDWIEQY